MIKRPTVTGEIINELIERIISLSSDGPETSKTKLKTPPPSVVCFYHV